jgi:hypothetical protein
MEIISKEPRGPAEVPFPNILRKVANPPRFDPSLLKEKTDTYRIHIPYRHMTFQKYGHG